MTTIHSTHNNEMTAGKAGIWKTTSKNWDYYHSLMHPLMWLDITKRKPHIAQVFSDKKNVLTSF